MFLIPARWQNKSLRQGKLEKIASKLKGHMQQKILKSQNYEKKKISIYKIDMQNVKSHRLL